MFRLFSYFSLTSAIAIALLTTALVAAYQHHATASLVSTTEKHNVAMARVISNSVWPRFAGYLTTVSETNAEVLRDNEETEQLHNSLLAITHGLPVHKVKFYNLMGTTVYSSEQSQIGENKQDNPGFRSSINEQKPVSKLSFRDKFSAFSDTLYGIDVVESYVPLIGDNGRTLGVFELYYDVSNSVDEISQNRWFIAKALIVAFMVLYLVLLAVVRRADGILRKQYTELQNALVQQERMSTLGRITSTVSHELRNPLAALRNAHYIMRQLSSNSAELQPHIDSSERSIARCTGIVEDLLEFDKSYQLDRDMHDFSKWAGSVAGNQKVPEGIELELDLQEVGADVLMDQQRLARAVTNLVENAVHACSQLERPGRILISTQIDEEGARIVVEDNARGIEESVRAKVFDPLFTTKTFAAGLGLTTAKRLVEQHGGLIAVGPSKLGGAKFTISLPAERQALKEAA
jgi:signal transduction histidine kinase